MLLPFSSSSSGGGGGFRAVSSRLSSSRRLSNVNNGPSSYSSSSLFRQVVPRGLRPKQQRFFMCHLGILLWRTCCFCNGLQLHSYYGGGYQLQHYFQHDIKSPPFLCNHHQQQRLWGTNRHCFLTQRGGYHHHQVGNSMCTSYPRISSRHFSSSKSSSSSEAITSTTTMSMTTVDLTNLSEIIRIAYERGETDGILQFALLQSSTSSSNSITAPRSDSSSSNSDTDEGSDLRKPKPNDDNNISNLMAYTAKELIDASLMAAQQAAAQQAATAHGRKGYQSFQAAAASSIINGWVGSCCSLDVNPILGAQKVEQLLQEYDGLSSSSSGDDDATTASMMPTLVPDIVTISLAYKAYLRASQYCASSGGDDSSSSPMKEHYFLNLAESMLERAERMSKKQAGSKRRKALAAARRRKSPSSTSDLENEIRELLGSNDFEILQETDDYLVINKPSGVSCYHKRSTTAGKVKKIKKSKKKKVNEDDGEDDNDKNRDISLEDALLHCNIPLSTLNPDGLGIVHRLDRGTSGCMVLAKTNSMHACLVSEFFLRRTTKSYMAVVVSPTTTQPNRVHDKFDNGNLDGNSNTITIDLPVDGRPAKSKVRHIQQYTDDKLGTIGSLVQVEIMTGRKHQVRKHCANEEGLGCPVLMDPLYGRRDNLTPSEDAGSSASETLRKLLMRPNDTTKDRLFLHSYQLSIPEYGIQAKAACPWNDISTET